jgi:hypothetical protein
MSAPTRPKPRRTRRVQAPFDARLEIRMYRAELDRLQDAARARGMSLADLVRFQLGDLLYDIKQPVKKPSKRVDLAQAIEDAGVLRRSMAVLKIKTEADRLARVAVDGVPLEGGK